MDDRLKVKVFHLSLPTASRAACLKPSTGAGVEAPLSIGMVAMVGDVKESRGKSLVGREVAVGTTDVCWAMYLRRSK